MNFTNKKIMIMRFVFLFIKIIIFLFLGISFSYADIVILKNGNKIMANKVWKENGKVICSTNGQIISFDLKNVSKIKRDKDTKRDYKKGGFKFDIWRSSMNIEEIILIARRHNIPLHAAGIFSSNKSFNPSVSSKYAKTATHYYYKTKVLGQSATIDLYLTPLSKRLHTLTITYSRFVDQIESDFINELVEILSSKYGSPRKKDQFFCQLAIWKPFSRIKIELKKLPGIVVVTYKDNLIIKYNKTEIEFIEANKKKKYYKADINKF